MTAGRLAAALALTLTLIVIMGSSALSATPATLGLRVTSEVYGDEPAPALSLASRANVPTVVRMTLPPGWTLADPGPMRLAPGQEVSVPFTRVGAPATMQTRQTVAAPEPGTVVAGLALTTKLYSSRPTPDDWTLAWMLTAALCALALATLALYWASRHLSLTRH